MKCIGNLIITTKEPKRLDKFIRVKINDEKNLIRILMLYRKIVINTEDKQIREYVQNLLRLTATFQEALVKAFIENNNASLIVNSKVYTKEELQKIIENAHVEYYTKENKYKYKRKKNDDVLVIKHKRGKFDVIYYFKFPIIR